MKQALITQRRGVVAAWLSTLLVWAPPGWAQPTTGAAPLRIGVYDSRAVAVAYAGSAGMEVRLKDLKARHQLALRSGDSAMAARLQAEGETWQARMHRQGFGTAPVDDLLMYVAADLPALQRAAGVSRLVSKWNRAELALHPEAQRVDVTLALVDAFHPSARQRKFAVEIQAQPPQELKE